MLAMKIRLMSLIYFVAHEQLQFYDGIVGKSRGMNRERLRGKVGWGLIEALSKSNRRRATC